MSERDIHSELLEELKAEKPVVPGFEYISEDPLGNLLYGNDGVDGRLKGTEYVTLLKGDAEKQVNTIFHSGNPADGINGMTLEGLVDIAIHRTVMLNNNIPHWHNNLIIDGLTLAANAQNKRNLDRAAAGVANTDKELPRSGPNTFHPVLRRLLTNQDKFNFIIAMMASLDESYDNIVDKEAQADFLEFTPEGPKRKFDLTAEEDEALTLATANSQKIMAVLEQSHLFQTILGTLVHGKKLQGSNQTPTSPTSETSEQPSDSTPQEI